MLMIVMANMTLDCKKNYKHSISCGTTGQQEARSRVNLVGLGGLNVLKRELSTLNLDLPQVNLARWRPPMD